MARDTSNMSKPMIVVKKQRGGKVQSDIPGDMKVHRASGPRKNTSAANYADAMDKVVGSGASGGNGNSWGDWP